MTVFEPFLREAGDPEAFSVDLEKRIVQAKSTPDAIGRRYPDFDTYMLAPLGYAVRDELARSVAGSQHSFGNISSEANPYVPIWTEIGADYYYLGRFPHPIDNGEFNPFREAMEGSIDDTQQEAVRIARSCLRNASGTVQDANLALRSLFNFLSQEPEHDPVDTGLIVHNSNRLIGRLARINDMATGKPGRVEFSKFVGIPARLLNESRAEDVIGAEHLTFNAERQDVDLTAEAKLKARECSPDGGCPSLRIQVRWRGKVMPMLMSFWDAGVEVSLDRIEKDKANPLRLVRPPAWSL